MIVTKGYGGGFLVTRGYGYGYGYIGGIYNEFLSLVTSSTVNFLGSRIYTKLLSLITSSDLVALLDSGIYFGGVFLSTKARIIRTGTRFPPGVLRRIYINQKIVP